MVEATIPGVVFAVAYPVSGARLGWSLAIALISAFVLGVVALWHRRPVQQVVASLVGVGIMAGWAAWRGEPEAFYFPSIVKNCAYAAVYAISCMVRWPLLGVVLGPILGEGTRWRKDPLRYRAYLWSSWLWAGMFVVRVAVQIPLYLAGKTTVLGFANIPLGLPLFLITCAGTWAILRGTHPTHPAGDEATAAASSEGDRGDRRGGARRWGHPGRERPVDVSSVDVSSVDVRSVDVRSVGVGRERSVGVGREHVLQQRLGVGGGHEDQLVARLERIVGAGTDHLTVAQDRDQGGLRRPRYVPDPVAPVR